jgi:hypothetical protein
VECGSLQVSLMDDEEVRIIRFGSPNDLIVALDSVLTERPYQIHLVEFATPADFEQFN